MIKKNYIYLNYILLKLVISQLAMLVFLGVKTTGIVQDFGGKVGWWTLSWMIPNHTIAIQFFNGHIFSSSRVVKENLSNGMFLTIFLQSNKRNPGYR